MFPNVENYLIEESFLNLREFSERWNARSFLYQLGTIKLVLRGVFDGTREEAYGRANCEAAAAG